MKALERPSYIQFQQEKALFLGLAGKVRKQIKSNPELKKFWDLGHSNIVPKTFPSQECQIAYELGKRNAEAADMDE